MYKYLLKKQDLYFPKKAFTLIELIIVIAVLVILAAIMIPALRGIQKNANRAVDIASAKTLYMAGAVILATDFEDMPNSVSVDSTIFSNDEVKSTYLVTVREYLGIWPVVQTSDDDHFFLEVSKDAESIEVWLGVGVGDGLEFNNSEGSFDWPD